MEDKTNLENYQDPFGETEEQKEQKRIDVIKKNEDLDKHAAEVAAKLRNIKIMLHARMYQKAESLINKLEEEEEKLTGDCCNISELYWCKVLLKYQARDDEDLISKCPDIEDDGNYILAVDFSTDEERKKYESVAAKIASAKEQERQRKAEEERKEAERIREEEAERQRKAEEERKRREEAERKRKLEEERQRREEAERQRKLEEERKRKEEAERLRKLEEERKRKAEAERQRKLEEERKRKEEEERQAILNIGDYKDIGGGYVTFGAYPQSKKASSVKIGEVFDKERGYYLGSDNYLYEKYNNKYYKVEPIKWKVLSRGSEIFIVADDILDAHRFALSSNNYANSEIRSWLNGELYNKAFNDSQKNKIVTTNVDNSLSSTGDDTNQYVCGNTRDKVFLLSRKEAGQYLNNDSARKKKGTDYAKARGLYVEDNGYPWWILRSPYYCYWYCAHAVDPVGDFLYFLVDFGGNGVVPALKIKL